MHPPLSIVPRKLCLCREGADAAKAVLRKMADGLQNACKQAETAGRQQAMDEG